MLGPSSIPTSRQSSPCPGLLHSTSLPSAFPVISPPLSPHSPALHCFLGAILWSSAFPAPHLLWCGQLILGVVDPGFIPSSSAYLCESFTRDSHPVWAAFSSNSRSSPIGGSGLAWKCTAGMIIYWWSCILLLLISFLIPLYFGVDRAAQWSQVGVLPHSRPWSFWSRDAVQWWARCESTWSMSAQGTQIDWLPSPCCNQTVGSTISLRPSSTTLSQHSLAPCCLHVSCSLVLHEISTGSLHSNSWLSQVLQFSFQPNPPAVLVWHVLL